ncbi:MAG: hypothetical protein EON98_03755 [Chitinophagaceae bacterium]|nr:MAG: hypothetical protein EON98_03755 [Chitinophagaceae bacterium]
MSQSKTYTAKDIERYHSGKLSAAEMNDLEKAALDDPFLADALDGYAFSKNSETELAGLQQRLNQRINLEKERRNLFFLPTNWMKIAALFILIAGGGWLVFRTFSDNQKMEELATNKSVNQEKPTTSVQEKAVDSSPSLLNAPVNNQVVTSNPLETAPENTRDIASNTTRNNVRRNANIPGISEQEAVNDRLNEVVVPIRGRSLIDSAAQTESLSKIESSPAFRSMPNDTIKNVDVVLKRADLPAEDVVVLNRKAAAPQKKSRLMNVKVDTLEPAEGWTNFDDYIANNIKAPDDYKTKQSTNGEVELSFEINKYGEPVNIIVTKSLCEKCDEEAIRLLKEGPKWKKTKKKGKVKIKF